MQHSKVIATGIICLALLGSVTIYAQKNYFFGQKSPNSTSDSSGVVVGNSNSLNTIANNTDWRKTLINLSVATNSPIQIIASQQVNSDNGVDNTLTGQVAQNFFALYIQDQKNGVPIDDTEATNIANQALGNISVNFQAKQYTLADIKISQDSSDRVMSLWANGLALAIQKNFSPNRQSELIILSKAIQTKNENDLAKLDPVIQSYTKAVRDILNLSVPQKAFPYDLVYVNTLSNILSDLQGMRHILVDPATGYIAFSNYQKDTATLKIIIQKMDADFGP